MAFTKDYWDTNRERILESRRYKYATDPDYQAARREASQAYRKKKREEGLATASLVPTNGGPVQGIPVEAVANADVGLTPARLHYFQKAGYIPAALKTRPHKLYTTKQIGLLCQLEVYLKQHGRFLRSPTTSTGQAAIAGLNTMVAHLKQHWED